MLTFGFLCSWVSLLQLLLGCVGGLIGSVIVILVLPGVGVRAGGVVVSSAALCGRLRRRRCVSLLAAPGCVQIRCSLWDERGVATGPCWCWWSDSPLPWGLLLLVLVQVSPECAIGGE